MCLRYWNTSLYFLSRVPCLMGRMYRWVKISHLLTSLEDLIMMIAMIVGDWSVWWLLWRRRRRWWRFHFFITVCLFWGGVQFSKFLFKGKLNFVMIIFLCSVSAYCTFSNVFVFVFVCICILWQKILLSSASVCCTMSNAANIPSSENYTPVDSCDKIWDNCCWFQAVTRVLTKLLERWKDVLDLDSDCATFRTFGICWVLTLVASRFETIAVFFLAKWTCIRYNVLCIAFVRGFSILLREKCRQWIGTIFVCYPNMV